MKIIVLGAGLVGAPMAIDLAKDSQFNVSIADINEKRLNKNNKQYPIKTIQKDLLDTVELKKLVSEYDIVVSAVPGYMGFQTLKSIIEVGKDVIDIAFFPEDPFVLNDLAKEKNVTAIMDFGVAPGMSNILVGYVDSLLDKTEEVLIYVGGLPEKREWPYEYKAPFSPIDVIEEYLRPARIVEDGKLVTRPALSEPELIEFPHVGTLEVFNTDGLRSLAQTIDAPNMKEKTMRYPGHIEKMRILRETGFFSHDEIDINGTKVRPIDMTTKLLFPIWEFKEDEEDITVMRVSVEGIKDGKRLIYTYDLFDRYDVKTNTLSMARTTGYTATMGVRMLAKSMFSEKGLFVPEHVGKKSECVEFLLKGLKERGVVYVKTVKEIS